MSSLRSANRSRKKYSVDAFDGIEDLLLQSGQSSDGESREDSLPSERDDSDEDEFQAGEEPSEADDDSMSGLDELKAAEEIDDDGPSDAGGRDLADNMSVADDPDAELSISKEPGRRAGNVKKHIPQVDGVPVYTRGVPDDIHHRANKRTIRTYYFGPTTNDYAPVYVARSRWGAEPCLPTRKDRRGFGGFAYTAAYRREVEYATANWDWYEQSGRFMFQQRQISKELSVSEAQSYLVAESTGRTFVMGPIERQKLYTLKVRQSMTLSEAFSHEKGDDGEPVRQLPTNYKSGFVINLGAARVNCTEWAPNQPEATQYLAISLLPKRRTNHPQYEAPQAPAFSKQPSYRSSIQIWTFRANSENYIDKNVPPRLSILICTEFGDVKNFKWCPAPAKDSSCLGLLACLFGDGAIYVFDIDRPASETDTTYLVLEEAAFTSKPPGTVCTSVTWINSSRIAASCANGFIAVWDLPKVMRTSDPNPRPEIYTSISTSYIMSICSCYPTFPTMLAATSAAGYTTLTDLSQPVPGSPAGTALSHRTRITQPHLVWHDHTHMAFNVEDNLIFRGYSPRRWFNTIGSGRVTSHATAMATSPCHPFMLVGTASGEVVGSNPVRRATDGGKTPIFQHTWFAHEWRRPTEEERGAAAAAQSREAGQPVGEVEEDSIAPDREKQDHLAAAGKDGLSRFAEGFKAVSVLLSNNSGQPGHNSKDRVLFATIYEERSAVTALAWNPNLHVAGWVAAGMGDGLLRVEDIAA